jgi:hypothetical protein
MPAVSTRGLGWLPDVPSIKDYTEGSAPVSTLLTRTQVSSRVGSGSMDWWSVVKDEWVDTGKF